MADVKKNDESSGKSFWDFVWAVLRDPKLRWIGIPLLLVVGFIYVKNNFFPPHSGSDDPSHLHPPCQQWTLTGRLMDQNNHYLNIKGVKVGIEAGPYSDDDQITDGKFFISKVSLPEDQIIHLFLECQSTKHFFYESRLSNIRFQTDSGTCTLTFISDLTVPADVIKSLCPPPPQPPPTRPTFSINLTDPEIRRLVESHSIYKYDPSSTNRIAVTFDPHQLEEVGHPPYYVFHQSNVIATLNGETFTIENCVIPDRSILTGKRSDAEDWARDQATQQATTYLKHNPSVIVQWLRQSGK